MLSLYGTGLNAKRLGHAGILALILSLSSLQAQNYIAYNVPYGTTGNQAVLGLGVGNDFKVDSPILISQLGVFVSGTNGILPGTELTVQLYERSDRHDGILLETLTFDAASSGTQIGGSFFKPLAYPVTLLPGIYTIAAYGFNTNNPDGNAGRQPYNRTHPVWTVNDGGGLIEFVGVGRYGPGVGSYPGHLDKGPANRYAAGTFIFSPATLANPPYAADYAALTAGLTNFPVEDVNHLGSIAVLDNGAFPVLAAHGGNRQVLEAAGTYNGDANGARAVVFSHVQWERAQTDSRMILFANAINWAAKKSNPSDIVVGITVDVNTNFSREPDLGFFAAQGYQVIPISLVMRNKNDDLPPIDVLVADWHCHYSQRGVDRIKKFTANGGGLVLSVIPKFIAYPKMRPSFEVANEILQPFNLAYRPSLVTPADLTFTNVQVVPFPIYFEAFPAAELLYQDRVGPLKLDSQQKVIALNTIAYSSVGQPSLLSQLTAVYAGATNNAAYSGGASNLVDVLVLNGAQASTNKLGNWIVNGNDLVAQGGRGVVEYSFNLPASDIYQIKIQGAQSVPHWPEFSFYLKLSIDGQNLGHVALNTSKTGGAVDFMTPFLTTGTHTLRILCDNSRDQTTLRIQAVKIQSWLGPDSTGNGLKDWVNLRLQAQSGMDLTNSTIGSYTSPVCLEGRDPYLNMMSLYVEGADNKVVNLNAKREPNNRWYANVPLSAYANAQTTFNASYQNGALTDTRYLQWLPINLLTPASLSIRLGDSLLFNALPVNAPNGKIQITVGTNQWNGRTTQPIVCHFNRPGTFTVTGTYTGANGATQSGNITVNVVGQTFATNPDSWVGVESLWNISAIPGLANIEADDRMFFESTSSLGTNSQQFGLITDENEARYALSRLGKNGPVLATATINGFQLWSGDNTYAKIVQVYSDGSQLVEMKIILSPVLPDLSLQLNMLVGGITFDDGTTSRTLTPASFDALGQARAQVRVRVRAILQAFPIDGRSIS